jgi:hypothetical protein
MKNFTDAKGFPELFAGLSIVSLGLVLSSLLATRAIYDFKRANDVLVVTGSAKRPIQSDYIIWRLSVSSQRPSAKEAYQDLQTQTEQLKAYLREKKVEDTAITSEVVDTMPIPEVSPSGRETGQILAYRLTQKLEIRSEEVERYKELSQTINELLNQGINITSEPPQYIYTKLDKLRVEMIAEATKDAQARAAAIAEVTGKQVGSVRNAQTGVFQITSRNSTDVSDYGIYDTSSLDKDITAVVSVTFSLKH